MPKSDKTASPSLYPNFKIFAGPYPYHINEFIYQQKFLKKLIYKKIEFVIQISINSGKLQAPGREVNLI